MRSRLIRSIWKNRRKLGISQVVNSTGMDQLGVPVVTVTRLARHKSQINYCQGKGATLRQAYISSLMEAVERHSAQEPHVVDPEDETVGHRFDIDELSKERRLRQRGGAFHTASQVFFPLSKYDATIHSNRPNTSGLAAGWSISNAVERGLFECVERYSVSRFYKEGAASNVPVCQLGCPIIDWLQGSFQRAHIQTCCLDISSYTSVPTVISFARSLNLGESWLAACGQATSRTLVHAVRKSLLEVAQARVAAIQSAREDIKVRMRKSPNSERLDNLFERVFPSLPIRTEFGEQSAVFSWSKVPEKHRRLFEDVSFVDLTQRDIGIPVVRVIAPNLGDNYAQGRGAIPSLEKSKQIAEVN